MSESEMEGAPGAGTERDTLGPGEADLSEDEELSGREGPGLVNTAELSPEHLRGALEALVNMLAAIWDVLATVIYWIVYAIVFVIFHIIRFITWIINSIFGEVFAPMEMPQLEQGPQGGRHVDLALAELEVLVDAAAHVLDLDVGQGAGHGADAVGGGVVLVAPQVPDVDGHLERGRVTLGGGWVASLAGSATIELRASTVVLLRCGHQSGLCRALDSDVQMLSVAGGQVEFRRSAVTGALMPAIDSGASIETAGAVLFEDATVADTYNGLSFQSQVPQSVNLRRFSYLRNGSPLLARVPLAVAIEDAEFYLHRGINARSILRALVENVSALVVKPNEKFESFVVPPEFVNEGSKRVDTGQAKIEVECKDDLADLKVNRDLADRMLDVLLKKAVALNGDKGTVKVTVSGPVTVWGTPGVRFQICGDSEHWKDFRSELLFSAFTPGSTSMKDGGLELLSAFFIAHHHGGDVSLGERDGRPCLQLSLPNDPLAAERPPTDPNFLDDLFEMFELQQIQA